MFTFLLVLTVVTTVLLVVVSSMTPQRSSMSHYELQRRIEQGDRDAKENMRRHELLGDVISLLRVKKALLLVTASFLLVATFGWVWGVILSLLVALLHRACARIGIISVIGGNIYTLLEPRIMKLIDKAPFFFGLIRSRNEPNSDFTIDSRQELQYLINQSKDVLSSDEKKLVVHALAFSEKTVQDVMTAANDIISIKKTEFLGPLTLDELHKSGHSRLPVIAQDMDHIVGILYLENLLALDTKRSMTAEKAMDARVLYVRQDQPLSRALAAMLRNHRHLFIVINELRETVGLVTLDDIIEALIGHKIIDEFDNHESVRAVAAHNPNEKRDND